MITITRQLRRMVLPNRQEQENLDQFRQRTREALRRPYHFEPKAILSPWEAVSTDPTEGYFKPFSQILPVSLMAPEVKRELTTFSFGRVVLPITLGLAALAVFLLWESLSALSTYNGVVSPVPYPVQAKKSVPLTSSPQSSPNSTSGSTAPVGQVVPPGTSLQPGGPYTGTGGYAPAPTGGTGSASGSTGPTTDPSSSTTTSVTSPTGTTSLIGTVQLQPSTNLAVPTIP